MSERAEIAEAKYVLLSGEARDLWSKLLAYSGLTIAAPDQTSIGETIAKASPSLWLVDVTMPSEDLDALRLALRTLPPDKRPAVVALLPSHKGSVSGSDLRLAHGLGADEFIISESIAPAIAARIHFALLKAGSEAAINELPPPLEEPAAAVQEGEQIESLHFAPEILGIAELSDRLVSIISESGDEVQAALIVINLDRFKRISTRYGRERSDDLLVATLMRIRTAVADAFHGAASAIYLSRQGSRVAPIVGRLQSDEFAVVLPGVQRREDAGLLAQEILEAIAEPLNFDGRSIYLAASAGIAFSPQDARDPETLLRAAHSALHHAKQRAGNSWAYYAPHLAAGQAQKLEIEHRLREAMASGGLELYFQPQATVMGRDVIGVEALLRWRHPDLGLVSPDSFISIAEEAGITAELGLWTISRAVREIVELEAHGLPRLRLSINVSADMLTHEGGDRLTSYLVRLLNEVGLDPSRLMLEITERTIVDEDSNALAVIDSLKAYGIKMALDDFGTGYSALSYLKALPIDELKIDRSFVHGAASEDRALLRAIISMAKTLNMIVTAEGVETVEQLARLADEGCDFFQGYLCAPPLPGDELIAFLNGRKSSHG
ncbi:MAG: hypothetical protein Tsb008_08600 [Rhodothalassiaceae bacterium]